jgi:uncharacterized integral membrane protein
MNFKVTKNVLLSIIVAFITLSLFITFTQDEFITEVSINLLLYKTAPFPVIYFITGAFLIGLFIGLFIAVIDHFTLFKEVKALKKELRSGSSFSNNDKSDEAELEIEEGVEDTNNLDKKIAIVESSSIKLEDEDTNSIEDIK